MKKHMPDLAGVLGDASGDRRVDILRRVAEGGSISEAARRAGVSYKAAWQAMETLGNLAGTPMVEKAVGGSGGGGAVLTPAGRQVLQAAAVLDRARVQAWASLAPATGGPPTGPGLAALALRTSMRNQFPCQVRSLKRTGGLMRVGLGLPGADGLFARITCESAELLRLAPGLHVLALCKATAVRVAAQIDPAEARNLLAGTVVRASRARAGGEVSLALAGGTRLVGFAGGSHGLTAGDAAMAAIDEAGVVLAAAA
jgi:molybdate transport system regulatory protein